MNDSSAQILGSADANFGTNNLLAQYIQSLPKEAIARMHQPATDAAKLMEGDVMGMLGALPSQLFEVNVTMNRQALGQLIGSAMMNLSH
jgi:phage terminase small subunit